MLRVPDATLVSQERRNRSLWTTVALLGAAAVAIGFWLQSLSDARDLPAVGLGALGGVAVFIGVPNGIASHRWVRRAELLKRGRNVVARWTVSPAEWRRFLETDTHYERNGRPCPNQLVGASNVGSTGLEVIVGRDGVLVGDDIFLFAEAFPPRLEIIPGSPVRLNLIIDLIEPWDDVSEASYRFPVGQTASAQVAQVRRRFGHQ